MNEEAQPHSDGRAVGRRINLNDFPVSGRLAVLYTAAALDAGYSTHGSWPVAVTALDLDVVRAAFQGQPITWYRRRTGKSKDEVLLACGPLTVWLDLEPPTLDVGVSGPDEATVAGAVLALRTAFPEADPETEHAVWVRFWFYGMHGPALRTRKILVPTWEAIAPNYPAGTVGRVDTLMRWARPAKVGQFVLWHGLPGTGKTYSIRALMWEWRAWCSYHYITDPDNFFGKHADYLMRVLVEEDDGTEDDDDRETTAQLAEVLLTTSNSPRPVPKKAGVRWRLLILEDTGELLSADARERAGQGFSRFLNVVDGLMGQGLRLLLLLTSNEKIERFHPAATRPGRCLAKVEFRKFTRAEASVWLAAHGDRQGTRGEMTLADLYAQVGGGEVAEFPTVGFAPQPVGDRA